MTGRWGIAMGKGVDVFGELSPKISIAENERRDGNLSREVEAIVLQVQTTGGMLTLRACIRPPNLCQTFL